MAGIGPPGILCSTCTRFLYFVHVVIYGLGQFGVVWISSRKNGYGARKARNYVSDEIPLKNLFEMTRAKQDSDCVFSFNTN